MQLLGLVIGVFLLAGRGVVADPPSVHGMLVFGEGPVYVSHLPMFHRPHDYQVIWEVALSPSALAAYQKSLADFPSEAVYTLVPEPFDLADRIANPRAMLATLYRGHFERGGTAITSELPTEIQQTIYSRKFSPSSKQPKDAAFLLFGSDKSLFLVHEIAAKPDFDQVLRVEASNAAGLLGRTRPYQAVSVPGQANAPLKEGQVAKVQSALGLGASLTVSKEIYLESGELAH
jgi:hypothetical protein